MEKTMNDKFKNQYTKFESYIREKYKNFRNFNDDFIKSNDVLKSNPAFWMKYRDLRNYVTHNGDIVYINEEGFEKFRKATEEIMNPPSAYEICTKKVYSAKFNTKVKDVITTMKSSSFSNVPIINEKQEVVGIFNYYTLFLFLSEVNEKIIFDMEKDTVGMFKKYSAINSSEDVVVRFISQHSDLNEIVNIFNKLNYSKRKRSVLLVTENGKSNQKLLGIITLSDLYNYIRIS